MATNTTNYNLVKPAESELYDVNIVNSNSDIIDSTLFNKTTALLATNLVTNGDFSNGTTGWTGFGGNLSVVDGMCQIVGDGSTNRLEVKQVGQTKVINNKYYYKLLALSTIGSPLTFRFFVGGVLQLNGTLTQGVSETKSGVVTATSTESQIYAYLNYADNATQNGKTFKLDDVLISNLTTIFGAGNEPTKEQVDWLLAQRFTNSWFDGTKELATAKELIKIAQVQSQYVTPTLLNSRTGTLKYLLTNDGFINLKGTASGGSLNTDIIVLPTGYRPSETLTFPIVANNTFGVVTISSAGLVRQTVGALTNVSLDGITFKVAQ